MRRPRTAAGKRLVDGQTENLHRAGTELGTHLVWTESEEAILERAGETVDRAEKLRKLLDSELRADEPRPAVTVKLSAEIRALDRLVVDLIGRLNPEGTERPKSQRHVRAARRRWDKAGGA
ncbi:hypothetical protein [Rhodococcus sp. NPDC058521]|uniref:hypothetical protein n=1 Tax=Rhodococcus sp. NPDC058521 TaxID=3346536 RepID=UPI00364BBFB7